MIMIMIPDVTIILLLIVIPAEKYHIRITGRIHQEMAISSSRVSTSTTPPL